MKTEEELAAQIWGYMNPKELTPPTPTERQQPIDYIRETTIPIEESRKKLFSLRRKDVSHNER